MTRHNVSIRKLESSKRSQSTSNDVIGMSEQVGPLDSEPDISSPVSVMSIKINANLHDLIKLPAKTPVIAKR